MTNLKYGLAIALVAGLAACGDDSSSSNNANNTANNTTNNANNTTNNANNTTNNSTNNANNTANNTTNNTTNNANNTANNTTEMDPPKCGDANEPARCQQSPEGYTWSTASIVSSFAVASDEEDCCFDFTGDNTNDNALGAILALVGIDSVNTSIAESIASGSLALVLEHDGLTDLSAGDFTVNFWLADWDGITEIDPAGNNTVLIDPASIDQGTQPQAYVPNAKLAANAVTAGPGKVVINLDLLGTSLALAISGARIEADVDGANSDLATGVALTSGKLGGYVKVSDIVEAVNAFADSCTCAGLTGELVTYNADTVSATCNGDLTAAKDACTAAMEDSCAAIMENCSLLTNGIPLFTDIDSDGDSTPDALSLGATFTAAGAKINGVSAAN